MTFPDPNILGAKTVQQLMTVLCAPPYDLQVPLLAQLPKGSTLVVLWKAAVTVSAEEGGSYRVVARGPWRLMLNLTIETPIFCLAGFGATAPRRASPVRAHAPRRRRERSRR